MQGILNKTKCNHIINISPQDKIFYELTNMNKKHKCLSTINNDLSSTSPPFSALVVMEIIIIEKASSYHYYLKLVVQLFLVYFVLFIWSVFDKKTPNTKHQMSTEIVFARHNLKREADSLTSSLFEKKQQQHTLADI